MLLLLVELELVFLFYETKKFSLIYSTKKMSTTSTYTPKAILHSWGLRKCIPLEFKIWQVETPPTKFKGSVKFLYNNQALEFTSTEYFATKKKAEHSAAEVAIGFLECEFGENIRPSMRVKTIVECASYGLMDNKNPDSIELLHLACEMDGYVPLGALLFIKSMYEQYHHSVLVLHCTVLLIAD